MVSTVTFIKDGKQVTVEREKGVSARDTARIAKSSSSSSSSSAPVQGPVRPTTDESTFRSTGTVTDKKSVQGPVRPTTDEPTFRETGTVTANRQATLKQLEQGTVQGPVRPSTSEATFRATGVAEQSVVPRQQAKIAKKLEQDANKFGVGEAAAYVAGGLAIGALAGAGAAGAGAVKTATTLFTAFQAPKVGEELVSKSLSVSQQEFLKSDLGVAAFRAGAARRDVVIDEKGSIPRTLGAASKLDLGGTFKEVKGLGTELALGLSTIGERDAFLQGASDFFKSQGKELTPSQIEALIAARAGRAGGEIVGIGLGGASAELIGAAGIAKGFARSAGRQFTKDEIVKLTVGQTIKPLIKAGALEGAAVELAGTSARKAEFSPVRTITAAGTGALSAATLGVVLVKAQALGKRTGKFTSGLANIADPTEIATDIIAGSSRSLVKNLGRKVTSVPVITAGSPGKFTFGSETISSTPKARTRTTTKIRASKIKTDSLVLPRTKVATLSRPDAKADNLVLPTDAVTESRPRPDPRPDPRPEPRTDPRPIIDPIVSPVTETKPLPITQPRSQVPVSTKTQIKPFTSDIIIPPRLPSLGGGGRAASKGIGRSQAVIGKAPSLVNIARGTAKKAKRRF